MQSVNNLVEKDEKVAWDRMKEDIKDHYITKLLHTAEQGVVSLSEAYKHSAEVEIKTADIGKAKGRKEKKKTLKKYTGLKFREVITFKVVSCNLPLSLARKAALS